MFRYSIVIPVYKRKFHLKNTLEALNHLNGFDNNDYEVIVVDDNSNDDTYEYIKGIDKNYNLKYYYFQKSKESYCAPAKNYGWRKANGDIVIFIDSDIIVQQTYLNEIERYFRMDQNIMVIGTRIFLPESIPYEIVQDKSFYDKYLNTLINPDFYELRHKIFNDHSYNLSTWKYPWLEAFGCNIVIPKKWLEKIGGFDENFKNWGLEDIELAYNLFFHGLKIVVNSKLEVFHQPHSNNKDIINPELYRRIDENTRYFLEKHPNALDMPEDKVYDLFKGFGAVDFIEQDKSRQRIVLEYKDQNKLDYFKKRIIEFSNRNGLEIIVYDYLENSDLDIWIQLLGRRNSVLKYYPVSKLSEESLQNMKGQQVLCY